MPVPYIAVNKARVLNAPSSFETFTSVGPKVCMVTANHEGFVGFQNHVQVGVFPMGGRYGAAKMDMHEELNPIGIVQYTMWRHWEDHEAMHYENFDSIFRLCSQCLNMVVEGPWEPLYEIVAHDLPENVSMTDVPAALGAAWMAGQPVPAVSLPYGQRIVAASDHTVIPGREKDFEQAIVDVMTAFKKAPGFLGYMVMKQIGASAIGAMQLTPQGIHQALQTRGDNPPRDKEGNFQPMQAHSSPQEYVVHMEWADMNSAMMGISRVVVNHKMRMIHDRVLETVLKGPYVTLWNPIMEDTSWREYLHS
ncbi:sulfur oxygenase reductase [Sulfobacillus acidophilus TPY]|jgi:sulfur oxygenase/reductase|uniref:Sulfur oxygenase reductase n=1 Tax=Sulfobacillus acidophilus (strain ATCC 700253 / DSM 10332 / NAL) TaxID=679936 RepID=G8TY32_SULAD|nr:sulfur oxygenase reductase [Sulfobacillus acidophilus TPY]AEW03939.1 sulfur oxygenase reductase [Sulfobacillus acidophilus DSM 10332]